MKTNYFYLLFLLAGLVSAQVLDAEDFNSLTVGNIGTAFDASVAGQANYVTLSTNVDDPAMPAGSTTTNAANSNYQIVANGFGSTQGLQITSPNGNQGFRLITKNPFPTPWASRTPGNNVVEMELQINTGAATSSESTASFFIFGDRPGTFPAGIIVGFDFNYNTKILRGLGTLNRTVVTPPATPGPVTFNFGLAAAPGLVLPNDSWVTIAAAYDVSTGILTWATDANGGTRGQRGVVATSTNLLVPNMTPVRFQIEMGSLSTNTTATTALIDNIEVQAVTMEGLLSTPDAQNSAASLSLYPNPVSNQFTIASNNQDALSNVNIFDMSGKMVFSQKVNTSEYQHDASGLKSGIYLVEATTQSGAKQSMKLVKE